VGESLVSIVQNIVAPNHFEEEENDESPVHVLIVDDDTEVRQLMYTTLRPHVMVHSCPTSTEGIRQINRNGYDILLLDWKLEDGMTGGTVLDAWMEMQKGPVCVVTGSTPPECLNGLFSKGVRNILTKPFDVAALLSVVFYYITQVNNVRRIGILVKKVCRLEKIVSKQRLYLYVLLLAVALLVGLSGFDSVVRLILP